MSLLLVPLLNAGCGGGSSLGIYDADLSDGFNPVLQGNEITSGQPRISGTPGTVAGAAGETNGI